MGELSVDLFIGTSKLPSTLLAYLDMSTCTYTCHRIRVEMLKVFDKRFGLFHIQVIAK